MNAPSSTAPIGQVASLHLHPAKPGAPLARVEEIEVLAGKGILGEPRYFDRVSRSTGKPGRRQVSLIEREQIAEHAAVLGLQSLPPGAVRANIETIGIDLVALIGKELRIGDAVLLLNDARTPCDKMDRLCAGLRGLMENNRQGVLAEVVRSGKIRAGDSLILHCPGPA